jgi:hypothetical protein
MLGERPRATVVPSAPRSPRDRREIEEAPHSLDDEQERPGSGNEPKDE